jgi:hypothetical protein
MVRRLVVLALVGAACRQSRPMANQVELPHLDSTVLSNPARMDSLLDTMPGGGMVKGNDSAAHRLLRKKM